MSDAVWTKALLQGHTDVPVGWCAPEGACAQDRMAVYRNNVWSSWVQALVDTFPVLHHAMGDAAFRDMAHWFVHEQPPRDVVLAHYGQGFADFVQRQTSGSRANAAQSAVWWSDMARLEYAQVQSFHAADAPVLSAQTLQAWLAQPQGAHDVVFELHPSVHVLHGVRPVGHRWWAFHAGLSALPDVSEVSTVSVLISRDLWDVVMVETSAASGHLVARLQQGDALGDAAQAALALDASCDVAGTLAWLLRHGGVSRVDVPTITPPL